VCVCGVCVCVCVVRAVHESEDDPQVRAARTNRDNQKVLMREWRADSEDCSARSAHAQGAIVSRERVLCTCIGDDEDDDELKRHMSSN
jgi:hypothetical protein